eukprot:935740-Amphidinium_carterae.1
MPEWTNDVLYYRLTDVIWVFIVPLLLHVGMCWRLTRKEAVLQAWPTKLNKPKPDPTNTLSKYQFRYQQASDSDFEATTKPERRPPPAC